MILAGLETFTLTYFVVKAVKYRKQKRVGTKQLKCNENKKHNKSISLSIASAIGALAFTKLRLLKLLNVSLLGYTTYPILAETEKSLLKEKKIKNDFLNSSILIICVAQGYYFNSALVATIYYLGSKLVARTRDFSEKMLHHNFQLPYETVVILNEGNKVEIPFDSLVEKDVVVIESGQAVPIDGTIVQGNALLDQNTLTGEAQPCEKQVDDKVMASTIVISGSIHVRTEKTGNDTNVGKINKILNNTSDFRTNLQLQSQSLADRAALPILIGSAISFPLLGLIPATTLLNSSPGNTLRIWASLQILNHLVLASRNGILVKDGRTLEELKKIDTILFDKTGTLTEGKLVLGKILPTANYCETDLLRVVASVEQKLSHPIAEAILLHARKLKLSLLPLEETNYNIGFGIEATTNGEKLLVGSHRFMKSHSLAIPHTIESETRHAENFGHSMILAARNREIIGAIELVPTIRQEAFKVIEALRSKGIKQMAVVSGDNEQPTRNIALQLGLGTNYYYNVLPQDKASIVESLQKKGRRVCFIGDGINDVLAMKKANVSISLTGATSVANDVAGVLLLRNGLNQLPTLFEIGESLYRNTNQSLWLSAFGGIANATGGLFLGMSLVASTIWMNCLTKLIGIVHAQRPLQRKIKSVNNTIYAKPQ